MVSLLWSPQQLQLEVLHLASPIHLILLLQQHYEEVPGHVPQEVPASIRIQPGNSKLAGATA